jgi:hypothetical protein
VERDDIVTQREAFWGVKSDMCNDELNEFLAAIFTAMFVTVVETNAVTTLVDFL